MKNMLYALIIFILAVFVTSSFAEDMKQTTHTPKKVQVDSNYDGKIDRLEYYNDKGEISKVEMDRNGDGKMDEWVAYIDGRPVRSERDTNGDGKPDVWADY